MSYILDAIKKTESGQKDGDVPNLNSEHQHTAFIEEDESKRWLLPLVVVIAVLVGVVLWLVLKPELGDTKSGVVSHSEQALPVNKGSQQETVKTTDSTGVLMNNMSVDESSSESMKSSAASGLVIKKEPLKVQQPAVQLTSSQVVEAVSRRPITEVVEQAEIQQQARNNQVSNTNKKPVFLAAIDHDHWPTLIYTTHIYATEPADRFVMLNGKAYSIGDTISKNLSVVNILENDLLVDYQGQKVIVPSLTDVNP